MGQILLRIEDTELKQIQKKAQDLGLTTSAYVRQVLKDAHRSPPKNQPVELPGAVRRLIPVMAEALGRTQNATPEAIDKLTKILLKKYDQEA